MDSVTHALLMELPRVGYHNRVKDTAAANLIAYYPMWDAAPSGVMADYSGNGYHLTWGAGTSREGRGIDGLNCAYLYGTNTAIDASVALAAVFPTNTGTIMVWGCNRVPTGATSWHYLLYVNNAAGTEYIRFNNQGTGDNWFKPSRVGRSNNVAGGTAREVDWTWTTRNTRGAWYQWCYTWDGTAVKIYQNGVNTNSGSGAGTWGAALTNVRLFGNATSGETIRAWMQHLAVWNAALTADEIMSLSR